jgi:hypothetical protein
MRSTSSVVPATRSDASDLNATTVPSWLIVADSEAWLPALVIPLRVLMRAVVLEPSVRWRDHAGSSTR